MLCDSICGGIGGVGVIHLLIAPTSVVAVAICPNRRKVLCRRGKEGVVGGVLRQSWGCSCRGGTEGSGRDGPQEAKGAAKIEAVSVTRAMNDISASGVQLYRRGAVATGSGGERCRGGPRGCAGSRSRRFRRPDSRG